MPINNISVSLSSPASNPHNISANILDRNPISYFSSRGIDSYLDISLEEKDVNCIEIGFYRGNERRTKFLLVKQNGRKFEPLTPHIFVSSGDTNNPQKFYFEDTCAQSIRISFLGNIDNSHFLPQPDLQRGVLSQPFLSTLATAYKNQALEIGLQDNGPDRQFLSIRSVAVLHEEIEGPQQEKLQEQVKEIGSFEDTQDKCYRCDTKSIKGVCPACGLEAGQTEIQYKYVVEKFPLCFDRKSNSFVQVEASIPTVTKKASSPSSSSSSSSSSSKKKSRTVKQKKSEDTNNIDSPLVESEEYATISNDRGSNKKKRFI